MLGLAIRPRTRCFQAFHCEEFDNNYGSFLSADYSLDCNDEAEYKRVFRLAWAAIILYPIAVPLTYALLLRAASNAIISQRPTVLSKALNFLHRDVTPRCYWWEVRCRLTAAVPSPALCRRHIGALAQVSEIVKKLFLVGFFVLIQRGDTLQLILGFLFCLVYFLFTIVLDPRRALVQRVVTHMACH